jgi:hypothetical protein
VQRFPGVSPTAELLGDPWRPGFIGGERDEQVRVYDDSQ